MKSEIRKEKKKKPPLGFSYTVNPLFLPGGNKNQNKTINVKFLIWLGSTKESLLEISLVFAIKNIPI